MRHYHIFLKEQSVSRITVGQFLHILVFRDYFHHVMLSEAFKASAFFRVNGVHLLLPFSCFCLSECTLILMSGAMFLIVFSETPLIAFKFHVGLFAFLYSVYVHTHAQCIPGGHLKLNCYCLVLNLNTCCPSYRVLKRYWPISYFLHICHP